MAGTSSAALGPARFPARLPLALIVLAVPSLCIGLLGMFLGFTELSGALQDRHVAVEQVRGQERDVLAPLAQAGNRDADLEPCQEVVLEIAFGTVGGRYQAEVGAAAHRLAEALRGPSPDGPEVRGPRPGNRSQGE